MEPLEFLGIAKKLLKYNTEANWRTSIGRSYYTTFNYLKQQLEPLGIDIPANATGHNDIVRKFHGSSVDVAVDIGSKTNDLYSQRLISDYRLNETVTHETAKLMFLKAKQVIDDFPLINKTDLKNGIEAYTKLIETASKSAT